MPSENQGMSQPQPLFRLENLKTRETGITAAVIGVLAAIISNLDRLEDAYDRVFNPIPGLSGLWLGVFRELDDTHRWVVSSESVKISDSRTHFGGEIDTTEVIRRHHDITGSYKGEFLIVEYRSDTPSRNGATVYFLQGQPQTGSLLGMWTGYDPDERAIMSCPYVLTRAANKEAIGIKEKSWLQRGCFSSVVTPADNTRP